MRHDHERIIWIHRWPHNQSKQYWGTRNNFNNQIPPTTLLNFQDYLDKMANFSADRMAQSEPTTAEDLVKEEVFKQTYIPQRLDEVCRIFNRTIISIISFWYFQVVFYERDIRQVKAGEKTELIYSTVTGIKSDLSGPQRVPEILEKTQDSDEEEDSPEGDDSEGSDSDSGDQNKFVNSARPRDESPNSKKVLRNIIHVLVSFLGLAICLFYPLQERKIALKAEKAEKRKAKVKKHVKKRKEKLAKTNSKK